MKMAYIYRMERKKILRSQFEIVQKCRAVVVGQKTVNDDMESEAQEREQAQDDSDKLKAFER